MEDNLLPSPPSVKLTYDELHRRRLYIESEIEIQEQYLINTARRLIKPGNIAKSISGAMINNVTNGIPFIDMFSQSWRWIKFAIRLIKRFT